ncbi:unnamed protein product, partial [marine sediment metagenome]
ETALGKEFGWEDYKNRPNREAIIVPYWSSLDMLDFIKEDMAPFKPLLVTMRLFDPSYPVKDKNCPLNDVLTDFLVIPQTNNDMMKDLDKAIKLYPQYENISGCSVSHT